MAFIGSVVTLAKWFPERRSLMTGLTLITCCAGALFAPAISQSVIGVYSGPIYVVLTIVAAQFLANPPRGWLPSGNSEATGYSLGRALITVRFGLLWSLLFLGCGVGNLLLLRLWDQAKLCEKLSGITIIPILRP